jgi:chromosomal replication initiation ATPase DnaA
VRNLFKKQYINKKNIYIYFAEKNQSISHFRAQMKTRLRVCLIYETAPVDRKVWTAVIRGNFHDFANIFAKIFGAKIGVLTQITVV